MDTALEQISFRLNIPGAVVSHLQNAVIVRRDTPPPQMCDTLYYRDEDGWLQELDTPERADFDISNHPMHDWQKRLIEVDIERMGFAYIPRRWLDEYRRL